MRGAGNGERRAIGDGEGWAEAVRDGKQSGRAGERGKGETGRGKREGRATRNVQRATKAEQGEGSGASTGNASSAPGALASELPSLGLVPLPAPRSPYTSAPLPLGTWEKSWAAAGGVGRW